MEFMLPSNIYLDVLDYILVTGVFLLLLVLVTYAIFYFLRKCVKLFRESKEDKDKKDA